MKRNLFIYKAVILSLLFIGNSVMQKAKGQVATMYSFASDIGAYVPINNGNIIVHSSPFASGTELDMESYEVELPFTFKFKNIAYNKVRVATNGYLTLGDAVYASNDPLYTSFATIDGSISAFGTGLHGIFKSSARLTTGSNVISNLSDVSHIQVGDYCTQSTLNSIVQVTAVDRVNNTVTISSNATSNSGSIATFYIGKIQTNLSGTAPNRIFTVEWSGFQQKNSNTSNQLIDFQIKLHESTNVIQYVYNPVLVGTTAFNTHVGIRGNVRTDFLSRRNGTGGTWLLTNAGYYNSASDFTTMQFSSTGYPAAGLTYTWTPINCNGQPATVNTTASATSVYCSTPVVFGLNNFNVSQGMSFQWQASEDGGVIWNNFGNDTISISKQIYLNTRVRCVITCTNSGLSTPSNPVAVSVSSSLFAGTASRTLDSICHGGSSTIKLTGNTATASHQWQYSTDSINFTDIVAATDTNYAATQTGFYRAKVTCGIRTVYSTIVKIYVRPELAVTSTMSNIRCGAGNVALSATANANNRLLWYGSDTTERVLATGNNYAPYVYNTKTFWVSAINDSYYPSYNIGPLQPPGSTTSNFINYGVVFNAYNDMYLQTVDVYLKSATQTSGFLTIGLFNNRNHIVDSITLPVSLNSVGMLNRLSLNFYIKAGLSYRLVVIDNGTITSPQALNTGSYSSYPSGNKYMSIVSSAYISGDNVQQIITNAYHVFYNWIVKPYCESIRVPVTATVTPAPPISAITSERTTCVGSPVTVNVSSTNTNYSYFTSQSVQTSPGVVPLLVQTTGWQYIDAIDSSGGTYHNCSARDSVFVNISSKISAPHVSPNRNTVTRKCIDDTLTLRAYGGYAYLTAFSEKFDKGNSLNFSSTSANLTAELNRSDKYEGISAVQLKYSGTSSAATDAYELIYPVDLSFSNNPTLRFKHKVQLNEGIDSSLFDYALIEYSIDSGQTWAMLPASTYLGNAQMTRTSYSGYVHFYNRSYATSWTAWQTEDFNLAAYSQYRNFKLRFRIAASPQNIPLSGYGWLIDDLEIYGSTDNPKATWTADRFGNGLPQSAFTPSLANNNLIVRPSVADTFIYFAHSYYGACKSDTATASGKIFVGSPSSPNILPRFRDTTVCYTTNGITLSSDYVNNVGTGINAHYWINASVDSLLGGNSTYMVRRNLLITLRVFDGYCYGQSPDTVRVNVSDFSVGIARSSERVCEGDSALFESYILSGNYVSPLNIRWERNDILIPNATSDRYYVKDEAAYNAIYTDDMGCVNRNSEWNNAYIDTVIFPVPQLRANSNLYLSVDNFRYYEYSWYKDNQLIATTTNNQFNTIGEGYYKVCVKHFLCDQSKCSNQVYISGSTTNGTNTFSKYISIYPNPANDYIAVKAPVDVVCMLFSVDGKLLHEQKNNVNNISINNLAAGVYILQVFDKDKNLLKVERIIKEQN